MEKNENTLELKKISNKPSLLNKIKHKANILFNIFPFVHERPFILPYLLERDSSLQNTLKNTLNHMRTKNFSSELIDRIYDFMVYKLMQAISKDYFAKYIINIVLNFNDLYYHKDTQSFSFLENYNNNYIIKCLENKPIPLNMNIDLEIIKNHSPKWRKLKSFIEDYFFDEINLFYAPLKEDISLTKNKDIIYLYELNYNNNINKIINLICIIVVNFAYSYKHMIKTNYKYIKKLYFIYYDDNFNNIFNKIELYLKLFEHKENIKSIYFHNTFLRVNEKEIRYFDDYIIYKKIALEYLVENYLERIRNNDKINFKFNSLENIEFEEYDDDDLINNIQIFRLRYNLNKIFGQDTRRRKLIMITPEDFNNIFNLNEEEEYNLNKKLDKFYNDNTKYKILYLNFKNNSPYNKNFVYFCEKYLYYNKYINIIIIDNLGNINIDHEYINSKKKKLKFPNLKCIIFEDKITLNNINKEENNEINQNLYDFNYDNYNNDYNKKEIIFDPFGIKSFINEFFDYSNFKIYEGYNNTYNLLYLNISKNITVDELYRIFFIENKISVLKLINENIEIKYNKDKKELILINNNNKEGKSLKTYKINDYVDFFNKLNKIMALKFDNGEILNINYNNSSENEEEKEEDAIFFENFFFAEEKEKEDKDFNEGNLDEIGNFLNSEILTEGKEFSLLAKGILKIENISQIKKLKFKLIYRAKSDKNKIDTIIDKIGKNKYMLILIKTNKGNIFGAYAYFYDYYYNNNDQDRNLGVVFNFKKQKLLYDVEGFIWKNDQGIEIKNYFYITKPSFSLKNKIINNLMEIEENNFICAKIEVYDIYNE